MSEKLYLPQPCRIAQSKTRLTTKQIAALHALLSLGLSKLDIVRLTGVNRSKLYSLSPPDNTNKNTNKKPQ